MLWISDNTVWYPHPYYISSKQTFVFHEVVTRDSYTYYINLYYYVQYACNVLNKYNAYINDILV